MKKTNLMGLLSLTILLFMTAVACDNGNASHGEDDAHEHNHMDHSADHDHDGMGHSSGDDMHEGTTMHMRESQTATLMIDHYLSIKDALVEDDESKAAAAAKMLAESVSSFDHNLIEGSRHSELDEILEGIKVNSEQIAKGEIDTQRENFEEMADDFLELLEITGLDRTLYKQYCPMYNDNEGGYWLSESKEIKNPLFGSKMLTCGSVKETISVN